MASDAATLLDPASAPGGGGAGTDDGLKLVGDPDPVPDGDGPTDAGGGGGGVEVTGGCTAEVDGDAPISLNISTTI